MAVTIPFGGDNRELKFRLRDMRELERLNPSLTPRGLIRAMADGSFEALGLAIWSGMKHANGHLSPQQVYRWLDQYPELEGADMQDLFDKVTEALVESGWFQQIKGEGPTTGDSSST